jgi:hypothetical protein
VERLIYKGCALVVGVALVCAGCTSKNATGDAAGMADFKSLVMLYSSMVKTGHPPATEAEFKQAIKGQLKPMTEALHVSDADALFTSKRDGKPIVILYGTRPPGAGSDIVAYEQAGQDGKRLVGYSLGVVEEVDAARFRELVPAESGAAPK